MERRISILNSSKGSDSQGGNTTKGSHSYGSEERGDQSVDINSVSSEYGHDEDNTTDKGLKYQRVQQVQLLSVLGGLDCLYFDSFFSPPFESCHEEITKIATTQSEDSGPIEFKLQKQEAQVFPLASLGILKKCQNKLKRLNGENNIAGPLCTNVSDGKLSTDAIIRLAGNSFIQSYSQLGVINHHLSMLSHPFASSFSGLSAELTRDVDLVGNLLASAEKVVQQQYERARKILNQCSDSFSSKGNPIQRLGYYFSQALLEKINRETGRSTPKLQSLDFEETVMKPRLANIAFHQEVPFSQVSQYTGMQGILDNVAGAKKVHVIDLVLINGCHIVVLMQALAARCDHWPLEHLKVTAVGTKLKQNIEETGKRLMNFAESLNLSFSFNVVMVADMLDLNEGSFELDPEEAVAVHSSFLFSSMIARPDRLDCLMRVIRNINPCIVVVNEVEANLNSPAFVNRFVEALFFYGALFDSLEDCMDQGDPNRLMSESVLLYQGMRSTVALEGDERTTRHVNINVWRNFFAQFGMVELDLSVSSLYQASLVIKKFACESKCTLDRDGKGLIIGWKGTPLQSLSGWKFL